jgi:predicted GNAT family acetyltransferase
MEPTVTDVPEADRYEIRDGDRVLGLAAYHRRGDTVVFTHTEVDPDAGQSGLGSTLVRAALDDVRARGGRVVAQCSFVRGWIERHPDYADLVQRGE